MNRQELFSAVWSEPLITVSKRLGVSDNLLRQACKDADIPVPTRGHWPMVHSGHPPKQPKLDGNGKELVRLRKRDAPGAVPGNPADAAISAPVGNAHQAPQEAEELEIATPVPEIPEVEEAVDRRYLEVLCESWVRQEQTLAFIARLDSAASALSSDHARVVRAKLRAALESIHSQDPVKTAIQSLQVRP